MPNPSKSDLVTHFVSLFSVTQTSLFLKTPSSSTQNLTALKKWPGQSTPQKSSCTSTLVLSPVSETTIVPRKYPSGSSWSLTCITSMSSSNRCPLSHTVPPHRMTPLILTPNAYPKAGLLVVHVTQVHKEVPRSRLSLLWAKVEGKPVCMSLMRTTRLNSL